MPGNDDKAAVFNMHLVPNDRSLVIIWRFGLVHFEIVALRPYISEITAGDWISEFSNTEFGTIYAEKNFRFHDNRGSVFCANIRCLSVDAAAEGDNDDQIDW